MSSESSYNSTDSSLVTVGYQLHFVALLCIILDLVIWHARWAVLLRNTMQSVLHSCGYSLQHC